VSPVQNAQVRTRRMSADGIAARSVNYPKRVGTYPRSTPPRIFALAFRRPQAPFHSRPDPWRPDASDNREPPARKKVVDGRHKAGHDVGSAGTSFAPSPRQGAAQVGVRGVIFMAGVFDLIEADLFQHGEGREPRSVTETYMMRCAQCGPAVGTEHRSTTLLRGAQWPSIVLRVEAKRAYLSSHTVARSWLT
jgi:hypothetical protein